MSSASSSMPIKNVTSDPRAFLANAYQVVIVGGGTAGLALAARLSENPTLCIGVIEAGEDKSHDSIVTSGGGWAITASDPQYHWGFSSVDQKNLMDENGKNGRILVLPRGKLLGGSSAINAMTWMRASKPEYDALERVFGNSGWNFDSLIPYFRKSQAHTPQPSPLFTESKVLPDQGTDGPTSYNWWHSSLISPFVKALQRLSFTINPNPDSGNNTGIINIAHNIDPKTSRRQDSVISYLKPTEDQTNICVLVGAHACNILFEDGINGNLIASGVIFQCGNTQYTVRASKEVVLSTGAYQTSQLLELSGIGKHEILTKFGIKQRLELPVGENLQDHLMVSLATKLKDEKVLQDIQTGSLAPLLPSGFVVECVGSDNQEKDPLRAATMSVTGSPFLATHFKDLFADLSQRDEEMRNLLKAFDDATADAVTPMAKAQYKLLKEWLENPQENTAEALLMFACVPGSAAVPRPDGGLNMWLPLAHFHPTSRGSVHISSTDPLSLPSVDLQCMNEYDFQVFRHLVRFGERVVRTEPLASLTVEEPPLTEHQLEEFIRKTASVVFHPVGTTPMASRELGGVVDSNLLVYGTKNLRVVDASVIPLQLGAMPQATIYAIAEKAADIMQMALKS